MVHSTRVGLLVVLLALAVAFSSVVPGSIRSPGEPLFSTPVLAAGLPRPHDDVSLFICKYGKPDVDDSTQYDRPRPPVVTRWLIYRRERVQAIYVPRDARIGDPPPYKAWKLVGFTDPATNKPISPEVVVRRMTSKTLPTKRSSHQR